MNVLLIALSLAHADPITVDLDGDGKAEMITPMEQRVMVGATFVPCESDISICGIGIHDISSSDRQREFEVCEAGIRDETYCRLYRLAEGKPVPIPFSDGATPPEITTSGNGIVLTNEWAHRLYTRVKKYVYQDGRLVERPQPHYAAGSVEVHVDRTFPVVFAPGSSEVVANVRPDSDVKVLLEDGRQEGWLLLLLSSGITGWVQVQTLIDASDHYTMVMSAG